MARWRWRVASSGVQVLRQAGRTRGGAAQRRRMSTREAKTMSAKKLASLGFVILVALGPAMLNAQSTVSYTSVTEQRLLNPEPQNWLMYRGSFNGWGYSPLDQVTPANVKKLVPVWTFSTGVNEGHQSPPIVNNGVMFVTTPQQQVIALNAKTGDLIWRYKKDLPEDLLQLHPTNRGVALLGDGQRGTVDGRHAAGRQPVLQLRAGTRRRHRQDPWLSPVPLERFLGLGRGLHAAPDRLSQGRPHREGPGAPGPQRLSLAAGAARRRHQVRRCAAVRDPGGLHQARSGDRTPELQRGAQAARGRFRDFLPRALGRQRLDAGGLQPEDEVPLHPGQRESLQHAGRAGEARSLRARQALPGHRPSEDYDELAPGRQPHRRAASLGYDNRPAGVDAQVSLPELGAHPHDRRRPRVPRRHQRP